MDKLNNKGFTLVEIIIVIAIIAILSAVTITTLKPQEIFANSRNIRRINDIAAVSTALNLWLSREGIRLSDPFGTLGLTAPGVSAITTSDGSVSSDGIGVTSLAGLTSSGYLQSLPKDPNGNTDYRVGVNNITTPTNVIVCTDHIEITSSYPLAAYPNHLYCVTN